MARETARARPGEGTGGGGREEEKRTLPKVAREFYRVPAMYPDVCWTGLETPRWQAPPPQGSAGDKPVTRE